MTGSRPEKCSDRAGSRDSSRQCEHFQQALFIVTVENLLELAFGPLFDRADALFEEDGEEGPAMIV